MRHVEGQDRQQATLFPQSLEEFVAEDHPVRVIDAYIDRLDLAALGFSKAQPKATGRKPYDPGDLLKLYVYGYLNRVSTSRRLQRECERNVEAMWLMKRLAPDFKTIADFRRDNAAAIRGACRAFIEFCRETQLLSGRRVTIDGSKFKAAASVDQALTRKQLARDRADLERRVQAYLRELDEADRKDHGVELERERVQAALEQLQRRRERLDRYEQAMDASGRNEHCAGEPEACLTRSGREGTILGYNVQCAVEAQSGLIVHHEVTNEAGDTRQLEPVARATQAVLQAEELQVLADGGYANGEHLDACERRGIEVTLPRRIIPGGRAELFQKSDFVYEAEQDRYRCPAGEVLTRRGADKRRKLHLYSRKGCEGCALQSHCTPSNTRGVTRHFFEAAYERSQARLLADRSLMRQRMAIAERPFAVIKHTMAFRRFVCRGIKAASAEMALAVIGYNLQQSIRLLGVPRLLALLR